MIVLRRERIFFLFFLPLFALKLLDITSENTALKGMAIICFSIVLTSVANERYKVSYVRLMVPLLLITIVWTLTSGKMGVFFGIIFLISLKDINPNRCVYKYTFWIGLIFFLLACYQQRQGGEGVRFINGEWTDMMKRSNLIYVSFAAVVSLFLLVRRNFISWMNIILLSVANYFLFLYVGSRTGVICLTILLLLIVIFKFNFLRKSSIMYILCLLTPILSFSFSIATGVLYGQYDFLEILDMSFQGRIAQEYMYYQKYPITLFGQKIFEGIQGGRYWCLDSAYWDMLLSLGLIFTTLWVFFTTKTIKFFYKREMYVEVAILVMYAVYGISETFLSNCFLNMSFFLYAEWFYAKYGSPTNLFKIVKSKK